ncbi:MAG: metal-dependent hydrolase [Gracilimonas sp.]|uniref:metal-dependent hydrolase n=1 Tax=Gracilimonas sp. TaxID=1974203 RepID=UPI001B2B3AB7|nr:metal-dependent hydrolase [Gracilimonas sp.]MBO6586653.1 metal-dependent hydrolase [Gracilimonas sp.]MBO6615310.1 metal-dependent hydrolase [Gracilimonas sp.]
MDPVTHGLIGATASQSFADKRSFRAAAFTGLASAMLADLDVFLGSASDPLLNLELHRQFTHSIVFIPVGALFATLLLWWFVKNHLTVKETYLFSLAGYATAGITDVFTSYGVLLFWPFSDTRVSLDIISVFDPLFTFGVILLTGMAFYKWKQLFAWLALGWMAFYLFFGFTQQLKATEVARQKAGHTNHEIHQLIVKPTIANNWLWSIRYTANDSLHTAGVKLIPFSDPVIYNGESTPLMDWESAFRSYRGTTLYNDIARFSKLSDGILIRHANHEQVIGDGRYSMLPTTLSPLWGIEVDTTKPNQHVQFGTYRDAGEEVRKPFLEMLF